MTTVTPLPLQPQPSATTAQPSTGDDRAMVERAREGDPLAQRALYDAHVDRIYRLAYRLSGRAELAQEFTQDAFVRAFGKLAEFRGESSFGTWLHTIAVSVTINGLRQRKRWRDREAPLDEAAAIPRGSREAEPDLRERLARAVAALPEGCRTVFMMHDAEGYTHEEIGEALGVSAGTSKAQLSRARAKLRVALSAFAKEWAT